MTKSSTKELFTSTEAIKEAIVEKYITKTREHYGLGINRPWYNEKARFELKRQFLKDLRDIAFSGTNGEDAVEHIERFLKIVDSLDIPNVTHDQIRLSIFPNSLIGAANEWLMDETAGLFTTWRRGDDEDVIINDELSNPGDENLIKETKIAEIFRIKKDIFQFETPLYLMNVEEESRDYARTHHSPSNEWEDFECANHIRADANANYNPYLDISRILNDHAGRNNDYKTQENNERFDATSLRKMTIMTSMI
uniref:Reverse transcriptase domain-containing protein n=1 Tax=Tanacetum cinerariifolium TaxID=118510 RepID=A0A6L2KSY5_TANCI|nr:hypothetical protein [Tanacetum cinerariifolium]